MLSLLSLKSRSVGSKTSTSHSTFCESRPSAHHGSFWRRAPIRRRVLGLWVVAACVGGCSEQDPSFAPPDNLEQETESQDEEGPNYVTSTGGTTSTTQNITYAGSFFDTTDYGWGGAGGAGPSADGLGTGDLTVLLILDKSASMQETWDTGSKWDVALNAFFLGMVGVEDALTIGTLIFPLGGECDVAPLNAPSQFQFQTGRNFLASWKSKSAGLYPDGATPLGLAFENANAAVLAARDKGLMTNRRFRVLVVTDGAPNCGTDTERVIYLASTWRALGAEIHVVGLPGSHEAATFLSRLADPNATTNNGSAYVSPTTGAEVEDNFSVIVR